MVGSNTDFSQNYRGLLLARITAKHTPASGPLSGRPVYEWTEQETNPATGSDQDGSFPRKGVYTSATQFDNCIIDPNDSDIGIGSFVWARMKAAVTGITVYETVTAVATSPPPPPPPPPTTNCKQFGWLLSGPRSNKVWRVRVSEAIGQCEACTTIDPAFGDTVSSTDRIAYHTSSPSGTQEIWDVAGNLVLCGGCATARILTNRAATTPSTRAQLEVTYRSTVDGSVITKTFDAECTPDDGTVVWALAADDLCPVPADETDYPCASLIRVEAECIVCTTATIGCPKCLNKQGPPIFKVTGLDTPFYPKNEDSCGCTWTVVCGDDTVTVVVDTTSITVTVVNATDGTATYVYDTNDDFPGCDNPPDCLTERSIAKTSGSAAFPASITLTPLYCLDSILPSVEPCITGTPDLVCTVVTGKTQTETMPFDVESGYVATNFIFGDETGCNPPGELYDMGVSCVADGCGGYTMTVSPLAAPTGETVPSSFSYVVHSTRPVYITFSGTLECCVLCDSSPGDTITLPYSGTIKQAGITTPYWCVDDGVGNFACTQADDPPAGTSSGPYATSAECETVCNCAGGGLMALAEESRPVVMMMSMPAPSPGKAKQPDKQIGNRIVAKYLYPCQFRDPDPTGEKATCAQGCQKGTKTVALYRCQNFGELVSLGVKTTEGYRTCRDCTSRQLPSSTA